MSNVILKCQVRVKNDLKFRNTHVKNSIKMLASSSPFETKSCGLLTLIIAIQQKSVPYVQINNGMALKIINVCWFLCLLISFFGYSECCRTRLACYLNSQIWLAFGQPICSHIMVVDYLMFQTIRQYVCRHE